ncbi:MAG: hypothetical protein ACR2P3_07855, partial [Geminicoccaceae bacterium]
LITDTLVHMLTLATAKLADDGRRVTAASKLNCADGAAVQPWLERSWFNDHGNAHAQDRHRIPTCVAHVME